MAAGGFVKTVTVKPLAKVFPLMVRHPSTMLRTGLNTNGNTVSYVASSSLVQRCRRVKRLFARGSAYEAKNASSEAFFVVAEIC